LSVEETRKRKEQSDKLNHHNIHQSRVKAIRRLYLKQAQPKPGIFHVPATFHGKSNPLGKWLAKRRLDRGKSMTPGTLIHKTFNPPSFCRHHQLHGAFT
jgi:hypothetical protein